MFDNLKQLAPKETAEFEFDFQMNGKTPTLVVAPATQVNRAYHNASMRRAQRSTAGKRRNVSAVIRQQRVDDRELYPVHVVKGWSNVIGDDGNEVPFSQDACTAFLKALPDHHLDDLRGFCSDIGSFATTTEVGTPEEEKPNT